MDKGFEKAFLPKDTQMANESVKRCSVYFTVRKILIKTIMKYCFISSGIALS
jgi:hypothetical protein